MVILASTFVVVVVLIVAWSKGRTLRERIMGRIRETDRLLGRRTDEIDAWRTLYKRWSKRWRDLQHLL